jgi:hypothetical protein
MNSPCDNDNIGLSRHLCRKKMKGGKRANLRKTHVSTVVSVEVSEGGGDMRQMMQLGCRRGRVHDSGW